MKKRIILYAFALSFSLFYSCKKDENDPAHTPAPGHNMAFHDEMDKVMMKMKTDMDAVVMTTDNDLDFAKHMIPHHQGSIDMAAVVMKYGKDAKLLALAQKFKEGDMASIERLNAFIASHGNPVMSADHMEFMEQMDSAMIKMDENMMAFYKSPDPDYDFSMMTTHHHQGAIDMAELELHFGKHADAKKEAQMIIDHQKVDIIELAKFRKEHGQPVAK